MAKKESLAAVRARIAAVRIAEAEALAERVRAGDVDAYRQARRAIKDGPIDEVRELLQSAINDRPRTPVVPKAAAVAAARPARSKLPAVPPPSHLVYLKKQTKLIGRLRRNGTGWVVEDKDGTFYALSAVDEARPGTLVDKFYPWLIKTSQRSRIIAVLQGEGEKRAEAREILGGAPGQGRSRKH